MSLRIFSAACCSLGQDGQFRPEKGGESPEIHRLKKFRSEIKVQAVFTRENEGMLVFNNRKLTQSYTPSRNGYNCLLNAAANHIVSDGRMTVDYMMVKIDSEKKYQVSYYTNTYRKKCSPT